TYVLFGALYCVFTFRRTHPSLRWPHWRRPALVWVAASIGVYALAIALFHALFIRPLVPARPSNQNYSYHPIAHPLVLSLAFPSNDLARREGILWQDDVGLTLAKRTIPEATYLGPLYEKALFRYYRNLWSAYPGEMARLYFAKFDMVGMPLLRQAAHLPHAGPLLSVLLFPAAGLPTGYVFLAALIAATAIPLWLAFRTDSVTMFTIGLVGMAGVLAAIESAVIMPEFYLQYHAVLLFGITFVVATGYQILVETIIRHEAARSAVPTVAYAVGATVGLAWFAAVW